MQTNRATAMRERARSNKDFASRVKKKFSKCKPTEYFMGTKGGIMALDLGCQTGVAVLDQAGALCWHTNMNLSKLKLEKRTRTLYDNLDRLVRMFEPSAIFSEKVLLSGRGPKESLAYMEAMVVLVSQRHDIPWHSIWPSALKKETTGNGRCKKPEMIEASKRRWNIEQHIKMSDNIADALAVASWSIKSGLFVPVKS